VAPSPSKAEVNTHSPHTLKTRRIHAPPTRTSAAATLAQAPGDCRDRPADIAIWYVAAWLVMAMAFMRGYIPQTHGYLAAGVFKPLIVYANSGNWGAETLTRLYCTAIWENITLVHPAAVRSDEDDQIFVQIGPLSPMITMSLCREMQEEHAARQAE